MTLRRYERYKDSGIEWLGHVPADWEVFQLRRVIVRIEQGWSPECESRPAEESEWGVLKTGCVNGGRFNPLENKALPSHLAAPPELEVATGDLLMSRASGSPELVGSTALVTQTPTRLLLSDKTFRLHVNQRVHKGYLAWCLASRPLRAQIECAISGAAGLANNLPQSNLLEFVAPFPSSQEQRDIAAYLDRETAKIDTLIADQQRLIELLNEKRQAAIAHSVTKGLNPSVPMMATGAKWLGDVPSHWTGTRMKSLFRQAKRQGHLGRNVLSVYRDYGVILKDSRTDNFNKTPEDLSLYQLVEPGDLVVNKMKAWQGSLGISALTGITSPDYVVFLPLHREVAGYLHYLLRSSAMVSTYLAISNGIRLAQWRLEPEAFLAQTVFIPPDGEQRTICAHLDDLLSGMTAISAEAERATALLTERRSALITAAVTGQIDVRRSTSGKTPLAKKAASVAS